MGVKKSRVSESEFVYKNGILYAKKGVQRHRLCECMIFYRNCAKCNMGLAKRESDIIGMMVKHARENSEYRQIKRPNEDHSFDKLTYLKILWERMNESEFKCECLLCMERGERQVLSVRGPSKMSMDRTYDNLGYTHKDQKMNLISKNHHSSRKRDDIPEKRMKKIFWMEHMMKSVQKGSKMNYDRSIKNIEYMEKAGMDVSVKKMNLESFEFNADVIKEMMIRKRSENFNCEKCSTELDYGDEEGSLTFKNNPKQASAYRIDREIGYTYENTQIVCCACQTFTEVDDSPDVYLTGAELSDLGCYLMDKIEKEEEG